jgi:hypothetical protein
MNDPVNAFDCLLEAFVIPQIGCNEIRIEMADFTVIAGLAYHQPGAVSTHRQLAGYLLTYKTGSSGNE